MTDALCHLVVDGNEVLKLKLGKKRFALSNINYCIYKVLSMSVSTYHAYLRSFISVRSPKDIENDETTFSSEMCHQVFGDNENIFGYTDLLIKLYYSAGSLQTYLDIEYTDKVPYHTVLSFLVRILLLISELSEGSYKIEDSIL